jgi:hypothetical protein
VLTRHTPEEFLRKHGRKMRRPDGEKAVKGRDFTVVGHGDGGCIVRPSPAAG